MLVDGTRPASANSTDRAPWNALATESGETSWLAAILRPAFNEQQIPHVMTQPFTALLELCDRALGLLPEPARAALVAKGNDIFQGTHHLFGVGLPVGGQVQASTTLEFAYQEIDKIPLNKPAFAVTLLWPRVWEEYEYFVD